MNEKNYSDLMKKEIFNFFEPFKVTLKIKGIITIIKIHNNQKTT